MELYQSSLPTDFAVLSVLYTIADSLLERLIESLPEILPESLHDSLLESQFERLVESVQERASHRVEKCFPPEAFGWWIMLSLWKLWLIEGFKPVEAVATRRL
jgi:hypothetical protein